MTDWFKKALLPAAGAALAVPVLAGESEGASFPKDAVVKHLKKIAGPEFSKIPQESIDNVLKWSTHDVPRSFGLDQPATNQADRNLLETALNSPFVYELNPKDFNNLRLAQSVFPEEAIEKINPSFKFLDPKSGSLGNYVFSDKTGKSTISYNPTKAKVTTPPHEMTHGVQDVPAFRAEFNRPTNLSLDAMEKTTNDYKSLIEGAPFKLSQLTPEYIESIPEHVDLIKALKESYKHNPAETMTREVADYFEGGLLNKDYQGLKNYSNYKDIFSDAAKTAFEDYKAKFPERGYEIAREVVDEAIKSGKYKHLSKAALATPFAIAGTQLADENESEAGPVKIENIFRGGKKTVRDSLGRLTYPIQDRAAYRTIDNPAGAGYFGDVFNVKLNMKNIFDPRYDTEAVFPIAKEVANRGIMSERDTIRNLVTGNWDALELGEDNYGGNVGSVQKVLQDLGYSGNHQLEPTSFVKGKWNIGDIVKRRYQDVYQTFDKNELQMGDNVTDRYAIDNTLSKRYVDDPLEANLPADYRRYANEIEAPFSYSRDALVKPVTLYNGEPLKQFDPMFKDVLEEFRPDAHYLSNDYENKGLFPPSQQPFSLQAMREKHGLTDMTDSWAIESSKKSNTKIEEDWVLNHLGGKLSFDVSEPDLKTLMKNTSGALSEAYFDNDIEGTKILVNDIKQIADQIKATGNDKIFKQFKDAFGQNQYDEYFSQPANVKDPTQYYDPITGEMADFDDVADQMNSLDPYKMFDVAELESTLNSNLEKAEYFGQSDEDIQLIKNDIATLWKYKAHVNQNDEPFPTLDSMGIKQDSPSNFGDYSVEDLLSELSAKDIPEDKLPPPNLDLDLDTPVNQNPFQYNNTNQPSIKYQAYADALLDPTTADEATLKQAKKFQDKNPDFSPKSVHKFKLENDIDFKKYTEDFDPEDVYYPSFNLKNVVDKSSKYWKPFLEDIAKESGFKPQTYALGNAAFKGEFPDWYKPTTQDIEYIESLNPGVKAGLSMDYQANVTNLKQAAKSWKAKQGAESESVNNVLKDLGLVGLGAASSTLLYPDQSEAGLKEKLSANPTELGKNLEKSIIDYLEGRGEKVSAPSEWYRGIPKGAAPESVGGDKYVHATPWADVAARGGKFDSPGGNDVYTYDNLPGGKYFRGGSLAGDPLEATRVGDIQGTSWEDALDKAKGLYDKRVGKSLDEVLGYGVKGKELEQYADSISKEVAGDVAREFKFGTFETDAFGKPGVWEGAEKIPGTFRTRRPLFRSQDDLFKAVERYEKEGVSKDNIAEIKILKNLGKYLPETSAEDGVITPHGNLIASALGSVPGMAWDLMKQYGGTLKKVFTGEPVNSEDTRNLLDIATLPINAVKGNAALAGISVLWPDNKEFDEKKMVKEGITYPANFIPKKDAKGKVLIDTSKLNFDPLGQAMIDFKQYENTAESFFK